MDQYRAAAYLDLLNGITADVPASLPACSRAPPRRCRQSAASPRKMTRTARTPATARLAAKDRHGSPPWRSRRRRQSAGRDSKASTQQSPPRLSPTPAGTGGPGAPVGDPARPGRRPGEGHGLGPLDPALCRELAIAAAGSSDSRLCVTVTDSDGIAIGHGCARAVRRGKRLAGRGGHGSPAENVRPGPARGAVALPARLNLTITGWPPDGTGQDSPGPPGRASWAFIRDTDHGPPGGYGCLDAHPARWQEPHRGTAACADVRMRPSLRVARLPAQ